MPSGLIARPFAEHDNGTDNIDPSAPPPEQGPMKIYAFPLGDDGLVSGPRRTFYDFRDEKGCDGMCVDEAGRVYLTVRSHRRPGVLVLSPQGKEVAHIPTGPRNQQPGRPEGTVGLPSNVEFGLGAEANVLYITVDTSLYRIPLKVKGFHVQYAR